MKPLQSNYHAWNAKMNRRARRREAFAALMHSPRLGIALLAVPILDRLRDKASAIIQQALDAEFERAAEQVMKRRQEEVKKEISSRAAHETVRAAFLAAGGKIERVEK